MAAQPRITVLLPTRHRNAEVQACIESAIEQAKGWPLRFVVMYDDDPEGYIDAPRFPTQDPVEAVLLKPRHYYVRAVNALFRFGCMRYEDFDYFLLSNDDVTFAPHWPKLALAALRAFPDRQGICELAGPELCAHYVSRRAFFEQHFNGYLGEPCYTFYFSDRELMMRAKLLGRYLYASGPDGQPIIKHAVKVDDVRREVNTWFASDEHQYFLRRVAHNEWPCASVPRHIFNQVFSREP